MVAQVIVEGYRTNEDKTNQTYTTAFTITYFADTAYIQLLSGTFTRKCGYELLQYLTEKGIKKMEYYRKGRLKEVWLDPKL